MFATCNLSLAPLRSEPRDRSEMVSQLLFGETVEVLESNGSWQKVRATYDDYLGWTDSKLLAEITNEEFSRLNDSPVFLTSDLVQLAIWNKNQICPLVIGSTLPQYRDGHFTIGNTRYSFEGNIIEIKNPVAERLLENAYMYLNSPYLWGGRSPFGVDCSGFTQMVYKLCGYPLLRDASLQASQGTTINLLDEAIPGDLIFFDNTDGKIVHVGILLPGHHIIHASGRVRIDRVDHQGIFNEERRTYSHNLRLIKRMFT